MTNIQVASIRELFVLAEPLTMNRTSTRNWIRKYLAEALRHNDGLAAALPLTRDQVIFEDPESAPGLSAQPNWSLNGNGDGSVVLQWLDSGEEEIIELEPSRP